MRSKYSSASITLRKAGINDVALLRYWDTQKDIIDSDPNDDWDWEMELRRTPSWRKQLIAELDSRPIGFIQIIDPLLEESHYWGAIEENPRAIDIWIGESSDRSHGYGTMMMNLALEACFKDPAVIAVIVDPLETNLRAHSFYERLGFRFMEKKKFDLDHCLVYRLSREDFKANRPK